jgi:hypothetical protein
MTSVKEIADYLTAIATAQTSRPGASREAWGKVKEAADLLRAADERSRLFEEERVVSSPPRRRKLAPTAAPTTPGGTAKSS